MADELVTPESTVLCNENVRFSLKWQLEFECHFLCNMKKNKHLHCRLEYDLFSNFSVLIEYFDYFDKILSGSVLSIRRETGRLWVPILA